jgi:hypothetical protein
MEAQIMSFIRHSDNENIEEFSRFGNLMMRTRSWDKDGLKTLLLKREDYFIEIEYEDNKTICASILRLLDHSLVLDGGSIVFHSNGCPHTFTIFENNSPVHQFVWNSCGEKRSRHFIEKTHYTWKHKFYRQKNKPGRIASFNHFSHCKKIKGQFIELMGFFKHLDSS